VIFLLNKASVERVGGPSFLDEKGVAPSILTHFELWCERAKANNHANMQHVRQAERQSRD
jgi:hypothetical protein